MESPPVSSQALGHQARERFLAEAPRMVAEGQYALLAELAGALPENAADDDPWVGYWLAHAFLGVSPHGALKLLEEAYERFSAQGDAVGRALSAISSTDFIFLEHVDFRLLEPWISVLERLLAEDGLDEGLRIRAMTSLFTAIMPGHMGESRTARWAENLLDALTRCRDPNVLAIAACQLMTYFFWTGQPAKVARVHAFLQRIDQSGLHPLTRSWLAMSAASNALGAFDVGELERETAVIQEMAKLCPMPIAQAAADFATVNMLLSVGRVAEAREPLERYRRSFDPSKNIDLMAYHFHRGWWGMLAGGGALAVDDARVALDLVDDTGAEFRRALSVALYAQALASEKNFHAALAELDRTEQSGQTVFGLFFRFVLAFSRASIMVLAGAGPAAGTAIREALALARRGGYFNYFGWLPGPAAALCTAALAYGIEPDTARELIRRRRLVPPAGVDVAPFWPWPIRIRALGHFSIELDGVIFGPPGKAQKKSRELLEALVALGGTRVPLEELADELWPESDGDRAIHAMETTIYRLRRMLGIGEAIQVKQGFISLNPKYCEVDVWELERMLESRQEGDSIQPLLDCFGGDFLPEHHSSAVFLRTRTRLRENVLAAAFAWVDSQASPSAALKCLRQLASRLPGNEEVYFKWLRLLLVLGLKGEAMLAYRRYLAEAPSDRSDLVDALMASHRPS